MNRRITNSEMGTFKSCKRKWWLSYYRRLGLIKRDYVGAAPLGSIVHECLELWYTENTDPLETLARIKEETLNLTEVDLDDEDAQPVYIDVAAFTKQCDLIEKILEGFVEWSAEEGLDAGYEVVAIEEKIEIPVDFPKAASWESVSLMGKLDVQVRRIADGAVLNRDWKTVQGLEEGRLVQHPQFKLYALLMKMRGQEGVLGAQRVMLRKVKRTANSKPPFYGVDEATYTDTALRAYHQEVWGVVRDIAEATDRLDAGESPLSVAYPRPSRDCSWMCEFRDVCPMFDDGSNAEGMLNAYFVAHDPLERYDDADNKETE